MKKFLLIAAMAALALGASADGYKIEQVWNLQNPQAVTGWDRNEIRQGFGMNGKFYVNCKKQVVDTIDGVPVITTAPTIYEIDQNGLTGVTFPGGKNCGICRDDAGNIIVSLAQFPNTWPSGENAGLRVINPKTGEYVDYAIPTKIAILGRCDFLGAAKGDLFEDGEIWINGGTQGTQISHIAITGGEVDNDNCYYMAYMGGDGMNTTTSVTINPYTDIDGNDALLYWSRNDNPKKLSYEDNQFTSKFLDLTNHANTNGMFPLVWDGKEFFIYSTKDEAHYYDCFAIAEAGGEPIVTVPKTSTYVNGFQSQWINAEVDADGVTIYQYFPGNENGHFTVWRLTKDVPKVYMLGGDDQAWDPTSGIEFAYDAEKNVYKLNYTFNAENNYFGFTTELAENNDDGGWAYIEPFRFGAIADEGTNYWYTGEEEYISLTWDAYHAIHIPSGEYNMTINLVDMKLFIEKVVAPGKLGDVNGDGQVNITDVTALISAVLNDAYDDIITANADLTGEGDINISDITALISMVLNS